MIEVAAPTALAFDDGPVAKRLGLVALATDLTIESDLAAVTGTGEVGVFTTRVTYDNPVTAATLKAIAPRLEAAADLILPGERLDAIAFGCTAASAAIGDARVGAALTARRPGLPWVTPTSGLLAACAALGVRRLAVLAPYGEAVSRDLARYLACRGLTIAAMTWLGVDDDRKIARITPAAITAAAERALVPGAEALFCSCTGLRAARLAPALEARLGVPVLTSNQVLLWQALRLAGAEIALPLSTRLP
jgi:maleate isomerase